MPPYSIILGLGEDGLPFLLELTNPAPGSLIITGDAHSGKTRLLHGILASAVFLNDSQHVTFNLIAQDPDDFSTLTLGEHCQESIPAEEESSAEMAALIEELAQLTERRRHGESMEPAVILAIDGLDACLESMDEQFFARLYWLVKHGPRSRVWTIASLAAEHTKHVDPRLVDAFRTRMIGFIADREAAKYLSGDQELDARDLERGAEFYLPYGEGWFRFWACE